MRATVFEEEVGMNKQEDRETLGKLVHGSEVPFSGWKKWSTGLCKNYPQEEKYETKGYTEQTANTTFLDRLEGHFPSLPLHLLPQYYRDAC